MSINRRKFIQATSLALCGAGSMVLMAQTSKAEQPILPIPPLLESRRGQTLFLTLHNVHWPFVNGKKTAMWGINGRYPGPTVRVYKNTDVKLVYCNRLTEAVAMTISGLQVPGILSGGPARIMSPNMDWAPVLPVRQNAATCWYHASTPARMAQHTYNGLVGMLLIEDGLSQSLGIPHHYGVDDLPLILQDKRLDNVGKPEYQFPQQGGFIGNRLLVNGVQEPCIDVPRGWVRLRLLNASNARCYHLELSDSGIMHVIASDLGFLSAPVAVQQLSLAPGERREILIDMSAGKEVSIIARQPVGFVEQIRGLISSARQLISNRVLTLKPTGMAALNTLTLPTRLRADALPEAHPVLSRKFHLGDRVPGINAATWDKTRIDVKARQGTWEHWVVQADMPQSFHIQGVAFLVSKVNGLPVRPEDSGFKDTVWVNGIVELLVYFHQPSSAHFPFVYHSQTLEMADRGSAGQLAVHAGTD